MKCILVMTFSAAITHMILLLPLLKIHIFVETMIYFFSGFFYEWKVEKQNLFLIETFSNFIKNTFNVTFDQFNASLLNGSNTF